LKGEIDYNELKEKLRDVIPLNSGGSYKLLWDMLYYIRLLKYVRRSQLKEIDIRYSKICATKKLNKLVELGLVKNTYEDVFISTNKSLDLLKMFKYLYQTLPKNISGDGFVNELNNTEVFIQALKLPDYMALLYPLFSETDKPYLKPDALLIRGTKEMYKLEFLEIEASKSNWNDWLENKRINYLKLAKDKQVYSYWKVQCNYLDIPVPDIKDFRFSVSVIGKVKHNFGEGFNFIEHL
jgi:hypothetical protein